MKTKENIQEFLAYFQSNEETTLNFDEEAILAAYQKEEDNQRPLAIKILSIFGGILASLAFLLFLGITGLFSHGIALIVIGALCVAVAIGISKQFDEISMDTISISSFIIGLVLIALGIDHFHWSNNLIWIVSIVIAFCTLCIVQNYMLSFASVLTINGSFLMLLLSNNGYDLLHLYVIVLTVVTTYWFLHEAKIISTHQILSLIYNPTRVALVFSLLWGLICFCKKGFLPWSLDYTWVSSVVIFAAIVYVIDKLLALFNINEARQKYIYYGFTVLVLLPTVFSPSISGALLLILLSFFVNYKTGFALGIIAFIYFIGQYYYDLSFTLLTKSIILFVSGVLFLGLYFFISKKSHQQ